MMKFLKRFSGEKGFTLIEIMIVVIILAILSGVALISFGGLDTQAKDARVQADMRTIATALKAFKALDASAAFPATLAALKSDSGNYHALLDSVPNDPYTNAPYGYNSPSTITYPPDAAPDPAAVDVTSGSTLYPSIKVK